MNKVYNCKVCSSPLSGRQEAFCSSKCKNRYFLNYETVKNRASERKSKLLTLFGGACTNCGYHKPGALGFYDKDGCSLHIDINELANSSLEKLQKKVVGAKVLCRNCIEEAHQHRHAEFISASNNEILKQVQDDAIAVHKRFNTNLKSLDMKNHAIVLGVSGGVDSVTMLDLFSKQDLNLKIVVAHLNHGVRAESDEDEKFVKDLSKKYGYVFVSKKLEKIPGLRPGMTTKAGNLEEKLREERRIFLLATVKKHKAEYLSLAHNQNDQAETFIFNLLRGAGPAGLSAMKMNEGKIIRPLLDITRNEIENYARANKLEWREDITNRDISYSRNYIRHQILPLFARLNPDYLDTIFSQTELQGKIDEHLKDEAGKILRNSQLLVNNEDKNIPASYQLLTTNYFSEPVLFEIFAQMYEKVAGDRKNFDTKSFDRLKKLVSETKGTKEVSLPGGLKAVRKYKTLEIVRDLEDNIYSLGEEIKLVLGENFFENWLITAEDNCEVPSKLTKNQIFINNLEEITVRNWKSGDRIAKMGISGTKKLQDLFTDAKIDRENRKKWPIFATKKGEIIFVPGLAKSRNIDSGSILLSAKQKNT